jgi:hypothetical protein
MMSMSQDNNKKNNQQRPEDNENEEFDWGKNFRQIGLIVIVAIMMVIFWQFFQRSAQPQANEIKYTDFKLFVEAGNVAQGEIRISGQKSTYFLVHLPRHNRSMYQVGVRLFPRRISLQTFPLWTISSKNGLKNTKLCIRMSTRIQVYGIVYSVLCPGSL